MNILELPVSITNWIILSDILKYSTDSRIFMKVFKEYLSFLPIYKVEEVCIEAQSNLLTDGDFQLVMEPYGDALHYEGSV